MKIDLDDWEKDAALDNHLFPDRESPYRILALIERIAKLEAIVRQVQAYAECDPIVGRMDTSWNIYKEAREALKEDE